MAGAQSHADDENLFDAAEREAKDLEARAQLAWLAKQDTEALGAPRWLFALAIAWLVIPEGAEGDYEVDQLFEEHCALLGVAPMSVLDPLIEAARVSHE